MEPLSFCVDCRALTSRSAVHDELASSPSRRTTAATSTRSMTA